MPDAAIGADVMVGFPGETDALFEESRQFIEAMPFTYLHVFTYSERPGTPAAAMPEQVPIRVRKDRNRVLRDLADEKNPAFRQSLLGREFMAVTLDPPGLALTDNYVQATLDLPYAPNRLVRLRPRALNRAGRDRSVSSGVNEESTRSKLRWRSWMRFRCTRLTGKADRESSSGKIQSRRRESRAHRGRGAVDGTEPRTGRGLRSLHRQAQDRAAR